MEPGVWIFLAGLGAWSALDGVSAGQFMVSRPLVTGILTGAALGDPATGFMLGLFLEAVHLGAVPAGGARLPEPGPAAVPATAVAVLTGTPGGLALGAAVGVVFALFGGMSVVAQRRWQSRLVEGVSQARVSPGALTRRLLLALLLDGSRGVALVTGGLWVVLLVPTPWLASWPLNAPETVALLAVLAAMPVGNLLQNLSGGRRRAWLLLSGTMAGMVLGYWLGGA